MPNSVTPKPKRTAEEALARNRARALLKAEHEADPTRRKFTPEQRARQKECRKANRAGIKIPLKRRPRKTKVVKVVVKASPPPAPAAGAMEARVVRPPMPRCPPAFVRCPPADAALLSQQNVIAVVRRILEVSGEELRRARDKAEAEAAGEWFIWDRVRQKVSQARVSVPDLYRQLEPAGFPG
jgi:hypothetical protein